MAKLAREALIHYLDTDMNPIYYGVPDWTKASESSVVAGRQYYTRSGSSPDYVYTPVTNPTGNPSTSNYYYIAGYDPVTPSWEIIGDDIEDMSMELNTDTDTFKNILGQTKVTDNGYEPSMDADPFYANPDSDLYVQLRDIAFGRLKGDACRSLLLEVLIEDAEDDEHLAFVQEVIVKPQSYGGGTEGVNIPFNVLENGSRIAGTVEFTDGVPEFTASAG